MKKLVLITLGMVFAFQLAAVAKGNDNYVPPPVPNRGQVVQAIHEEERHTNDISPVKPPKHDDNGNGNGNSNGNADNNNGGDRGNKDKDKDKNDKGGNSGNNNNNGNNGNKGGNGNR